jgi:Spy/CpxP family protein refolding chaperone
MNTKYVVAMTAGAIGSAALAFGVAYAHGGFGGHGHHHGSAAAKACIAVMTPDQRANLKPIFTDAKSNLMADHQKVKAARQDLNEAILSKTADLSSLESNLSSARLKLLQDQDAAAVKVCGMLNDKQLSAAHGLYKNLVALRQSSHQQMRDYFKQARDAAGDTSTSTQGSAE